MIKVLVCLCRLLTGSLISHLGGCVLSIVFGVWVWCCSRAFRCHSSFRVIGSCGPLLPFRVTVLCFADCVAYVGRASRDLVCVMVSGFGVGGFRVAFCP